MERVEDAAVVTGPCGECHQTRTVAYEVVTSEQGTTKVGRITVLVGCVRCHGQCGTFAAP